MRKKIWETSKNTVKGTVIVSGVGLLVFSVKQIVSSSFKEKEKKRDQERAIETRKALNKEDLATYEEKLKLRKQYGWDGIPETDPGTNDGKAWSPLKPKYYNPLEPIESPTESRLFACAIHKGDVGIVVAAKGVGKTTLCMQIGDAIAAGKSTGLWPRYDEGEHKPQRVLYYDGELFDEDMHERYYRYCYEFAKTFERFDRNQFSNINDVLRDLNSKLSEINEDCTVIIDNVTKLCETAQIDKIKQFNDGIESLHVAFAKKGVRLTVISIIHILGKEYTPGDPITTKVAAGGSDLTNFSNFVIALEQPKDENGTLLVKVLNSRSEREPDKVCVLKRKDDKPCLRFEYCGEMDEKEALSGTGSLTNQPTPSKSESALQRAKEVKLFLDAGHTQEEAAIHYKVSRQTIHNWLEPLKQT